MATDLLDSILDSMKKAPGVTVKRSQQAVAPTEEGSSDSEARSLRIFVGAILLGKRGMRFERLQQTDVRAYGKAVEHALGHVFHSIDPVTGQAHHCVGQDSSVHAQMEQIEERALTIGGKTPEMRHQLSRLLLQMSQGGCSMDHFQVGQAYLDYGNGKSYRASGDVYVCSASGLVHHCTEDQCEYRKAAVHGESIVCMLTYKSYGTPVVHYEADPDTEAGRDGGASSEAKGPWYKAFKTNKTGGGPINAGHVWGPSKRPVRSTATDSSDEETNQYEGNTRLLSARKRKKNREYKDSAQSRVAQNTDSPYLIKGPQNCSLFVHVMSKRHTHERPEEIPHEQYIEFRQLVHRVLTDPSARNEALNNLRNAQAAAIIKVADIYKDQGHQRDMFQVMEVFHSYMGEFYRRLLAIGNVENATLPISDETVDYLCQSVATLAQLLAFTSHAKRTPGVFKQHGFGLLYHLHNGFQMQVQYNRHTGMLVRPASSSADATKSDEIPDDDLDQYLPASGSVSWAAVTATSAFSVRKRAAPVKTEANAVSADIETATVVLLPAHSFLSRLPTLSELNRFASFGENGSSRVLKAQDFLRQCFESLLQHPNVQTLEDLRDYTLERYIHVRFSI